jgi:hypothetical protein
MTCYVWYVKADAWRGSVRLSRVSLIASCDRRFQEQCALQGTMNDFRLMWDWALRGGQDMAKRQLCEHFGTGAMNENYPHKLHRT